MHCMNTWNAWDLEQSSSAKNKIVFQYDTLPAHPIKRLKAYILRQYQVNEKH